MPEIAREQFSHWLRIPTRWGDMDVLGHVNNAVFFTFDESARLHYFNRLMAADDSFWKQQGLILANIGCDFIAQLHHPAEVDVGYRVSRLGGSSLRTEAGLFVGEKLVAITRAVIVWFEYPAQKSVKIPEHVKGMIRSYEVTPPEE